MNKDKLTIIILAIALTISFITSEIKYASKQSPAFAENIFKNAYNKGVTNGVLSTGNSLMELMIKDKSLIDTFTTRQIIEIQYEGLQAAVIH